LGPQPCIDTYLSNRRRSMIMPAQRTAYTNPTF
jgi:hypothetical protein